MLPGMILRICLSVFLSFSGVFGSAWPPPGPLAPLACPLVPLALLASGVAPARDESVILVCIRCGSYAAQRASKFPEPCRGPFHGNQEYGRATLRNAQKGYHPADAQRRIETARRASPSSLFGLCLSLTQPAARTLAGDGRPAATAPGLRAIGRNAHPVALRGFPEPRVRADLKAV